TLVPRFHPRCHLYHPSRASSSTWQSNGLLIRRFRVRIPGGPLALPPQSSFALLDRFPNVVPWVSGHTHMNTVTPRVDPLEPGGGSGAGSAPIRRPTGCVCGSPAEAVQPDEPWRTRTSGPGWGTTGSDHSSSRRDGR